MVLKSFAKLNLYLEVLSRRKDNYHQIKTIFERIDLCDKISLQSRRDRKISLSCDSPGVPTDNSNLAFRSARLLQDKFKVKKGVEIKIIKRIPVGAGLGGGSSNAACVLLGLDSLWRLRLSRKELLICARNIGSDVPFFIYNCPFAWGSGRGDKIKPIKVLNPVRLWHILVVPKIKVSTPLIYQKWDALTKKKVGLTHPRYDVKILPLALCQKDLTWASAALFNSLETVTGRCYPEVGRIRERLCQLGLPAILMSGSGPAVFGITSNRKEAQEGARQLRQENKSWQVFVNKTV